MANVVLILSISIICIVLLILAEIFHLSKGKKKIPKPSSNSRIVVPTPSKIKKTTKIPKTKPRERKPWFQKLGTRSSEQEITRQTIRKRESEKTVIEEKEFEKEESKRDKLRLKIKELEEKRGKISPKTSAIELARERTEFAKLENEKSKAIEMEEPEIFSPSEPMPTNEVDRFNDLIISIYNDINTGMVSDAKNHYQELLRIYSVLVKKVSNQEELYKAVKDVREALMAVLK